MKIISKKTSIIIILIVLCGIFITLNHLKGEYNPLVLFLANCNIPKYQYELGEYYYHKNKCEKAIFYYTQASESNYPLADEDLFEINWNNKCYKRDIDTSLYYINKRIKNGHRISSIGGYSIDNTLSIIADEYTERKQYDHALRCIEDGIDYFKSIEKSVDYLKNKKASILYQMGFYYYKAKDYVNSIKYFNKSKDMNNSNAIVMLGALYNDGIGVNQNYKKAFEFFEKAANMGNSSAMFWIGQYYQHGIAVNQNVQIAKNWYEKSAQKGNSMSKYILAVMYYFGDGVDKNFSEAYKYAKEAAVDNNERSQFLLGLMHLDGNGCRQDIQKAKEYFGQACDNGYEDGCKYYKSLNR